MRCFRTLAVVCLAVAVMLPPCISGGASVSVSVSRGGLSAGGGAVGSAGPVAGGSFGAGSGGSAGAGSGGSAGAGSGGSAGAGSGGAAGSTGGVNAAKGAGVKGPNGLASVENGINGAVKTTAALTNGLGNTVGALTKTASNVVSGTLNGVGNALGNVGNALGNVANAFTAGLSGALGSVGNAPLSLASGANLADGFGIGANIAGGWDNFANDIEDTVGGIANGLGKGINGLFDTTGKGIATAINSLLDGSILLNLITPDNLPGASVGWGGGWPDSQNFGGNSDSRSVQLRQIIDDQMSQLIGVLGGGQTGCRNLAVQLLGNGYTICSADPTSVVYKFDKGYMEPADFQKYLGDFLMVKNGDTKGISDPNISKQVLKMYTASGGNLADVWSTLLPQPTVGSSNYNDDSGVDTISFVLLLNNIQNGWKSDWEAMMAKQLNSCITGLSPYAPQPPTSQYSVGFYKGQQDQNSKISQCMKPQLPM